MNGFSLSKHREYMAISDWRPATQTPSSPVRENEKRAGAFLLYPWKLASIVGPRVIHQQSVKSSQGVQKREAGD